MLGGCTGQLNYMAQLPSESLFGDYSEWPGRDVLDSGGERLGGVREIYLDRETGHPEWVLVDVDGDTSRFVPLADAQVGSATIQVAHTASQIKSAPGIGAESQIDQTEERRLYAHYGLGYSETDSGSGLPDDTAPVPEVSTSRDETIASAAPPATPTWGSSESTTETFDSVNPTESVTSPTGSQPTGWGTPEATSAPDQPAQETPAPTGFEEPADAPRSSWGAPGTDEPAASTPPPTPWGTPEPTEAASTEDAPAASSWSAAASKEGVNDAPTPASPPSPAEIEAAEIPEPPAATERALDFDAPSEPAPVLDTPAAEAPPVIVPETPAAPPLTPAVSPPELATANPSEPVSAASQVPPRPTQAERPAWTSSPPQPEQQPSGALAAIKERPAIAIAAVVATVLFLIVRRLR